MPSSLLLGRSGAATAGGGSYETGPSAPETTYHFTKDGLVLWLKADAITGLVDDDPVTTWSDSSGNGNDVTQATADNKPLYKTNIQNGLPVVRFDGVNDALSLSSLAADSSFTLFLVAQKRSAVGVGSKWLWTNGTSAIIYANSGVHATGWNWSTNQAGGEQSNVGGPAVNWNVLTIVVNSAASLDFYTNGGTLVNFDPADAVTTNTSFTLGSTADCGDVDVSEVILYNRALSIPELQQDNRYLGNKWGITIG